MHVKVMSLGAGVDVRVLKMLVSSPVTGSMLQTVQLVVPNQLCRERRYVTRALQMSMLLA
jgi:hypothetical protein